MDKRITVLTLLLSVLIAVSLFGCGKEKVFSVEPAVIVDFIKNEAPFGDMSELTKEQILLRYTVDFDTLDAAVVFVSNKDDCAEEIAVFKVKDKNDIDKVLAAIGDRKNQKLSSFKNLNTTEYKKVEMSICETIDNYVFFVVSKESEIVDLRDMAKMIG